MNAAELLAALSAAEGNDAAAREVVRACIKSMRDGTSVEHMELAEVLAPLARHSNARVRQEIADGCDLFPAPFYEQVLAIVESDADHFVCAAAKRSVKRHGSRKKERAKGDDTSQEFAAAIEGIATKDGKAARRRAERAVRLGIAELVARVDHERKRNREPLDIAVSAHDAEIARPTLVRSALMETQRVVKERIEYESAIFDRLRGYAERVRPAFAEEALWDVVDQARRQLLHALGERATRADVTMDVDRSLTLEVDRHCLLQALENVMKNAVEAYADGARAVVRVSARAVKKGAAIELCVADEGVGMNEATLAALFVPFASKKVGGTGVGMGTVRKMIEDAHDGELTVTSAVGVGTTVTMVVPVKQG